MTKHVVSTRDRSVIDRDAVRRAELQVRSVLAAVGALGGAMVTVVLAAYLGIGSQFAFTLGLLAVGIGTAVGVVAASRLTAALRGQL